MKYKIILLLALVSNLALFAQSFSSPLPLSQGEVLLPVEGIRAQGYYSYTAPADQLITLLIPSPEASVFLSQELIENPTYSRLPVMNRSFYDSESMTSRFLVRQGQQVFLKVSFICWDYPESGTLVLNVDLQNLNYKDGYSLSDPVDGNQNSPIYLPLTVGSNDLLQPVYVRYHTSQYGFLQLVFEPSVTLIEYAYTPDAAAFSRLSHSYVMEEGKTVGAKTDISIQPGQDIWFRVSGFTPSILSFAELDPEPGTMCEYPADIAYGVVSLPKDPVQRFWRIIPQTEGFIEVSSPYPLPDGEVSLSMDCNGFGSFTIPGVLNMRAPVWDNMEYVLCVDKPLASSTQQEFSIRWVPSEKFDVAWEGEPVSFGEQYATPPFEGTYYYRISVPHLVNASLKVNTLSSLSSSNSHVTLYQADNLTDLLATGQSLDFIPSPNTDYILKVVSFEKTEPYRFSALLEGGDSSVDASAADVDNWFEIRGRSLYYQGCLSLVKPDGAHVVLSSPSQAAATLLPGVYMITSGNKSEKFIIN